MATIDYITHPDGTAVFHPNGDLALHPASARLPRLYPKKPLSVEVDRAGDSDLTTASLSWDAPSDANEDTVYIIRRAPDMARATFTNIATVSHPTTSYSDTGLDKDTSYKYAVMARHQMDDFTDTETQSPESNSEFSAGERKTL